MMRWLRSLFGGSSRLQARDIAGCVNVGGNSGIVYQVYNGGALSEPPSLPWENDLPAAGPFEILNLLRWSSRLSQQLIGRDREKQDLLDWAGGGRHLRIRLITGPGGAGKTRLAAELAQSLPQGGWHAGFTRLENNVLRPLSAKGLLLIIDYPEEWRAEIRILLQSAAQLEALPAPLRVLLLSRQPMDHWRDDIVQAGASSLCDSYEVTIGPLATDAATHLFHAVTERLAANRKIDPPHLDETAVRAWVERDPALHSLPLYTVAAAIHAVLEPTETLGLTGAQIVTALVERERRRLDAAGRNAGWGEKAGSRLAGLAALRAGLDPAALCRLAAPRLQIGLPPPERVVDAVRSLGLSEQGRLPAPSPDLVAAELLHQVLRDRSDLASEWLWETLNDSAVIEGRRLDRLAHDIATLHRPDENILVPKLGEAVAGNTARAGTWRSFLDSDDLGFRLSPVGIAIAEALLGQPSLADQDRAGILNNLSNHLSNAGNTVGALAAIREAVDTYRQLVQDDPSRLAPDLALSLNNLSTRLSDSGDGAGALAAIREAVDIYRRLARDNLARFAPDLASSLNNLSNRLGDSGDGAGALAAIREAVDTYRRLAQNNPARFAPDLALSLNNLSNRLSDASDGAGALAAICEAVEIRRRLAQDNPARFAPDLALSLNNLSNRLRDAGDGAGALAVVGEAVEIRRRLAQDNPVRFAPGLAASLNNLSLHLSDAGDGAGALAAIREAVEIYRRLAQDHPARFAPDLALSLNNLSNCLSDAGDGSSALTAIREAVEIRRRLAQANPVRFAPDLASSLNNLSNCLCDAGDGAAALAAVREASDTYRRLVQENPARFAPDLAGASTTCRTAWVMPATAPAR
jgi:hypothetical protein